jgi:hypothetical protein
MITIQHDTGFGRIWLQWHSETKRLVGAIHLPATKGLVPDFPGYRFEVVSSDEMAGVMADASASGVLITFDDHGRISKVQPAPAATPKVVAKAVPAEASPIPTSVEHGGRAYGIKFWSRDGKMRFYVRTPGGADLGTLDLIRNEWEQTGRYDWSSPESEREFLALLGRTGKAVRAALAGAK